MNLLSSRWLLSKCICWIHLPHILRIAHYGYAGTYDGWGWNRLTTLDIGQVSGYGARMLYRLAKGPHGQVVPQLLLYENSRLNIFCDIVISSMAMVLAYVRQRTRRICSAFQNKERFGKGRIFQVHFEIWTSFIWGQCSKDHSEAHLESIPKYLRPLCCAMF